MSYETSEDLSYTTKFSYNHSDLVSYPNTYELKKEKTMKSISNSISTVESSGLSIMSYETSEDFSPSDTIIFSYNHSDLIFYPNTYELNQ